MMGLSGNVAVSFCVPENWASYSGMVMLLIILPLHGLLFSGVDEISCDLVEGKAGVRAYEHVCVEQYKSASSI